MKEFENVLSNLIDKATRQLEEGPLIEEESKEESKQKIKEESKEDSEEMI